MRHSIRMLDPSNQASFIWYTFESRQALAAASAGYDAARSDLARLSADACDDDHEVEKARKRLEKKECKLHNATMDFVRGVDQFFGSVDVSLYDYLYEGTITKPVSEAA